MYAKKNIETMNKYFILISITFIYHYFTMSASLLAAATVIALKIKKMSKYFWSKLYVSVNRSDTEIFSLKVYF